VVGPTVVARPVNQAWSETSYRIGTYGQWIPERRQYFPAANYGVNYAPATSGASTVTYYQPAVPAQVLSPVTPTTPALMTYP
jgi:hypothetical protein